MSALKRLLTRVDAHVSSQMVFLGKAFIALLALIRLLTRVDTLVFCQIASLRKAFITLTALIRLLTRVDTQVFCQSAFARKAFIPLTAPMRLLTCVDQQMPAQVASLPEGSCTERAQMLFITEVAVGKSARWQATDLPLGYITFAVVAMLEKWLEL